MVPFSVTYFTQSLFAAFLCSSEGVKSCHWVNSSNQTQDGGFQFQLSHSLSPYAEESTKLELTAEAIINDSFLRRTKRFYLRDISKLSETELDHRHSTEDYQDLK